MQKYNVWNKWGNLKTVMLGDHYRSSFFKDIKNSRIRSALQRIADETQEDLEFYETVLKDFGCQVIRPDLDPNDNIMNYIDEFGKVNGAQGVPRSPLQPRDGQLVIGDKIYYTNTDHPGIRTALDRYNKNDSVDWVKFHSEDTSLVEAPCMTVVGRDIFIDQMESKFHQFQVDSLKQHVPNIRINTLGHGGHSDGCFHTIKKGAILSLFDIQKYEQTFPDWDVCYLPNQSWSKVRGFLKLKRKVQGKWWVPGEEENNEFTSFVETWLQDWVGYVEETVFDVNVFVLDEHHVCVNNMNPTVIEFLKKHNMEPVYVPWRHRYFWDGGLHCITLDLEREGLQEDYFPNRGNKGIVDVGFNS